MENVKDAIMQSNKRFLDAFNNGNAKGVALKYVEKAKLLPPNSNVIQGLEGIEAFWKGAMDMGLKKAELETILAEEHGNTAIEEGRYKLFLENGQIADNGKYIVIWRKAGDSWKMDLDIWNSSNPPV
jgi:ketosteroid isomerase-like protein